MTATAATKSMLVEEVPTSVCSPPQAAKSAPGREETPLHDSHRFLRL